MTLDLIPPGSRCRIRHILQADSLGRLLSIGVYPGITLAAQPHCGKSTFFNALSGARHHVAKCPGVTVDAITGLFNTDGRGAEVADLPGTYSLTSQSPEERDACGVSQAAADHERFEKRNLDFCALMTPSTNEQTKRRAHALTVGSGLIKHKQPVQGGRL